MARFKGVYRRTWYENQMLFHAMTDVLRAFGGAGIPTILLKGAALVLQYYGDYGLRSMEDFDILVPPDQARRAVAVLRDLGFTPQWDNRPDEEVLTTRHGWDFQNDAGWLVDLHWYVFHDQTDPEPDVEFWNAAVPRIVGGIPTATLNPADQLLHVIVHGTAWVPEPSVRWVPDAMAILRSGELDWARLLTQARRRGYTLLLRMTLPYLRETLGAPVPLRVCQELKTAPVSRAERITYAAKSRPPERWGPWLALCMAYLDFASATSSSGGRLPHIAALPRYLQRRWGAQSVWHVPVAAAYRLVRRIGWAARSRVRRLRGGVRTARSLRWNARGG